MYTIFCMCSFNLHIILVSSLWVTNTGSPTLTEDFRAPITGMFSGKGGFQGWFDLAIQQCYQESNLFGLSWLLFPGFRFIPGPAPPPPYQEASNHSRMACLLAQGEGLSVRKCSNMRKLPPQPQQTSLHFSWPQIVHATVLGPDVIATGWAVSVSLGPGYILRCKRRVESASSKAQMQHTCCRYLHKIISREGRVQEKQQRPLQMASDTD